MIINSLLLSLLPVALLLKIISGYMDLSNYQVVTEYYGLLILSFLTSFVVWMNVFHMEKENE